MNFKVKSTLKVKIYPIACPCNKSPPIEVSISKFGPKMHLSTVKVPIDFGRGWPWCSVSFLISNLFILPKFASHYSFASVCIYSVRPLPVSAAHSTWHCRYTDSFMHADNVEPWTVKQSSFISWLDRLEFNEPSTRRLARDFTSSYRFLSNYTHLTCHNFICQHSAITETTVNQRPLAIIWFDSHWESPLVSLASMLFLAG